MMSPYAPNTDNAINNEIDLLTTEIQKVQSEIDKVQVDIEKVEGKIIDVEKKLEGELSEEDRRFLRDKENKLRDEKNKLRDKENKLIDKENKLRDEKTKVANHETLAARAEERAALTRIEKKVDGMATMDVPMSKAGMSFSQSLLQDLKVAITVCPYNHETRETALKGYIWGEKEEESQGQPGCKQILESEMGKLEVDGNLLGVYDIRNHPLPHLKAGNRKSKGNSDLGVGLKTSMDQAVTLSRDLIMSYVVALVELKTGKADLKQGQLLLQLFSLSLISETRQGVVVLGTDCASKWRLLHFSDYNNIVVKPYSDGGKCMADFKKLIEDGGARKEANAAPEKLTNINEGEEVDDEVDVTIFGLKETDRDKAIGIEDKLSKIAAALEPLFGESLEVPSWAKASATCPSYYT